MWKDGISAAVVMTELILHLASQGLLLSDYLEQLYQKYGYHRTYNSYYICRLLLLFAMSASLFRSPPTIERIFAGIRAVCQNLSIILTGCAVISHTRRSL